MWVEQHGGRLISRDLGGAERIRGVRLGPAAPDRSVTAAYLVLQPVWQLLNAVLQVFLHAVPLLPFGQLFWHALSVF
jgi:hypothetical protein